MHSLPYTIPDRNIYLNIAILLLILHVHGKSQRGKVLLNNERIMVFMYLVKNPVLMSKLLIRLGLPSLPLAVEDIYSVTSLAVNVDSLFDNDWIKSLLRHAASLGLLDASYKKVDGFMYVLSESGESVAHNLTGHYFDKVRELLYALEPAKGESTKFLSVILNEIFRK